MRTLRLLTLLLGIGGGRFAFADSVLAVTVGDSIVKTYPQPNTVPIQGWGATIRQFTTGVVWVNQAVGGTSTKSYIERGYWAVALSGNPAFVLIQFGYGDASPDPESHTEPAEYRANLHRMILDVRATGGEPILVTPAAVRTPAADGIHLELPSGLQPWADAMIAQAAEDGVQVIDMHAWTLAVYEELGVVEAQRLYGFLHPDGWEDRLHFSVFGATEAGRMVASNLPALGPPPPPEISVFPYALDR